MLFSLASFEGRARFGPVVVVEELVVAPRFLGGCWDLMSFAVTMESL